MRPRLTGLVPVVLAVAVLVVAVLVVAACTAPAPAPAPAQDTAPSPSAVAPSAVAPSAVAPSAVPPPPSLEVTVLARGLDHPWDVAQAPDGTLLVDERDGGFTAVLPDGAVREVAADMADLLSLGETGLMGLVLDAGFEQNRRFYSCQGRRDGAGTSIAVVAWTVDADWRAATRVADPLLGGLPVDERTGRHGGCRLRLDATGALLVGTGDTTDGDLPQDLAIPAGKVLRIDPATGGPAPDTPFPDRGPLVWTLGHRNVQGLAVRPGSGRVFAVEHGPDRDDEVNLLTPGGNYGWDPSGGDGYDQSVPMTDPAIPGAVRAVWSSGEPTVAPGGATFLQGAHWGGYEGLLLLGLLKGRGVLALRLDEAGRLVEQARLPGLEGTHGRIRTVQQGRDGALYVTTDNGDGTDVLLRVTPG